MISNTYANNILDVMVGKNQSLTAPASLYLGLCKTQPDAATGAVADEPSAASYARKSVGGYSSSGSVTNFFGKASGGIITNNAEIQMKTARESWGEGEDKLNYWFLSNGATGNAIIWGELYDEEGTHGIEVAMNTVPTFYEGTLKASIDVELD